MNIHSISTKTLVALVQAIIGKDDFADNEAIIQFKGYIELTPFYVKLAIHFSVVYFNVLSIIKKQAMLYSLAGDHIVELLKECEKSFYGQSIIMIVKLISTLVYFDDDIHAAHIGYTHLEHCR
ncbi:MAG: hypothetical protein AB1444_01725 [Spirochaetota bacterium]